jgi:hypothetical protein
MISVHLVAHGGMDAKIRAKKMEMKNAIPVKMAVRPVLPPSEIPAPPSIYVVTGGDPKNGNQDSHDDGALDSVHHEQNGEHPSIEDSNPHGRISSFQHWDRSHFRPGIQEHIQPVRQACWLDQ